MGVSMRGQDSRRTFLVQAGLAAGGMAASRAAFARAPTSDDDVGGQDQAATAPPGHGAAAPTATAGQAPPFSFSGVTMPQRKSFYDFTADDLSRLQTAYARLKGVLPNDPKNLPANDPRSWLSQANIHAAHCGGNLLEVHRGWWFPAWHRCFLFFYERILASLCDNPAGFALPYWDWVDHQEVPNASYLQAQNQPSPFFDQTSPLHDPLRFPKPGTTFQQRNLSNAVLYCGADYINNRLLQETDFTTFCGGDPTQGGQAGDLEAFPHNNVHIWTGLNDNVHRGQDMDDLTTAAKDLLFFLHHANVDRIFTLWLAQKNPLAPAGSLWYSQWFNFYDADGKAYSVTVNDALTHMAGNYEAPQQAFPLVTQPQAIAIGGPSKTFQDVALPSALQANLAAPAPAVAPVAPRPRRVRLRFEAVEAPHDVPVVLHIFLNKTDATLADVNGDGFAGTITLLQASASHGKRHRMLDLSLEIPPALVSRLKGKKTVSVTIVPEEPGFRRADDPAPQVNFKRITMITRD